MVKRHSPEFVRSFWDRKLEGWDRKRYEENSFSGAGIRSRLETAVAILRRSPKRGALLELGCGAGRLGQILLEEHAGLTYTGLDISSAAIELARKNYGTHERLRFEIRHAEEADYRDQDFIVSLGFLDWLSPEELRVFAEKTRDKKFLHSISEAVFSGKRLAHVAYTWLSYGIFRQGYVPRYHTRQEIRALFGDVTFERDPRMGFGLIFHNLERKVHEKH